MTLRIVDGDAHLLEGAEFIIELMEAHPDKVQFQSTGGISGATIEGKRFPNSTGKGCGVDAATSLTLKANNPFEPHGVVADADREGIDVMVCYPSLGIGATAFDDTRLRGGLRAALEPLGGALLRTRPRSAPACRRHRPVARPGARGAHGGRDRHARSRRGHRADGVA